MERQIPLIITATPNNCWLHPEVPYPRTPEEVGREARLCREAGASILHLHSVDWSADVAAIRAMSDMIVQCGMSSLPIPERMEIFRLRSDMISIITSHHDEAFTDVDTHALHTREELVDYARLSAEYGVKLEFETWHTGSIWNLRYLIDRKVIEPPYFTSLFFGWPGGSWSPPTVEEYLYRRRYLPESSIATVSIMDERQIDILAAAILAGDHIRVGTEDYPFDRHGSVAQAHDLVAEAVELAKALGRPVATPDAAREIIFPRS
ncbi:MAG: 3-keto-5-aminohexanoate cleavage protein [Acidimicrobiales bacterium]|jgi:3-keto-5-aminohexanoate cleavage enzyme